MEDSWCGNDEPPLYLDEGAKVHHSLVSEGCEINGTVENSVVFSGVKIGKGALIKNSVILPHTIIEENVWIENAVVGSHSSIKSGVIIVSKTPDVNLMVVGNNETIDPTIQDYQYKSNAKTALSYNFHGVSEA
jgi:glucose-1-phosphate adenylyltransferase